MHARGIIHRDSKPSNLFLRGSRASDLVLLDFGVARRLAETKPLTGTSVLVGTPHYMAARIAARYALFPVSSGLVEDRFVTHRESEQHLLVGERVEVDTDRLLLGKPTPCVSRNGELLQLEGLVSSALDASVPRTALVLGPPGIDKSRLRRELLRRLDPQLAGASVLLGYGDLLSAGSPYVRIADALLRHAGISIGEDLELVPRTPRALGPRRRTVG